MALIEQRRLATSPATPRSSGGAGGEGTETARPQQVYGVVLDLPERLSKEIAERRERYSPRAAASIFPHITLRAPFTPEDPKLVGAALERVARLYLPVAVRVRGLGTFRGPLKNVLFARVERTEPLRRLHEAVVEALHDVRDAYPGAPSHQFANWVPHVTIAFGMNDDRLEELAEELRPYVPEGDWEAHELLLVRSRSKEDGSLLWTTTRSFARDE